MPSTATGTRVVVPSVTDAGEISVDLVAAHRERLAGCGQRGPGLHDSAMFGALKFTLSPVAENAALPLSHTHAGLST
jgi:hypothetical protein